MPRIQSQPVLQAEAALVAFSNPMARIWFAAFPVAAIAVISLQPGFVQSAALAGALLVSLLVVAFAGAVASNRNHFSISQSVMAVVAPAQFALMIWASVHAGHFFDSASLLGSTLAAFAVFAILVLIDFVASVFLLMIADRSATVGGTWAVNLVEGKYAGLLGKTV